MLEQIGFSFARWSQRSEGPVVLQYDILCQHERAIDPQAVKTLYTTVGWWPEREAAEIAQILGADLAVGSVGRHSTGRFARVVSDQHFRAFIEDVVVHPAYQRRGIGRSCSPSSSMPSSIVKRSRCFASLNSRLFMSSTVFGLPRRSRCCISRVAGIENTIPPLRKQSPEKRE